MEGPTLPPLRLIDIIVVDHATTVSNIVNSPCQHRASPTCLAGLLRHAIRVQIDGEWRLSAYMIGHHLSG
jgi:hypothetical protein